MLKTDSDGFVINDSGEKVTDKDGNFIQVSVIMSQDQVDKIVKDRLLRERKKLTEENETKLAELTAKLEASVSSEEKSRLEGQIQELQESLLSAEEKAKKSSELKVTEERRKAEEASNRALEYEKRYKGTVVTNEVITSAATNKFLNPEDALGILKDKVAWDKDDDGKEVFKFQMEVKDKDGKPETRLLSTSEAVKAIAEDKPYLIRGTNTGGFDKTQNPYKDLTGPDIEKLSPTGKMAAGYAQNAK